VRALGRKLCIVSMGHITKWRPVLPWHTRLADRGVASSQYKLGVIYTTGRGVEVNHATAVDWFTKAAAQGHADAQYELGLMYLLGFGVVKNHATAVGWFTKAAEQAGERNANAQFHLGIMYMKGSGVQMNEATALDWFVKAAEQGHAEAKKHAGLMIPACTKAAEQGDVKARLKLGYMYMKGSVVEENRATAREWFIKAEQGSTYAQYILGVLAEKREVAVQWFTKAAAQGHADAQYELGRMYEKGHGVAQNNGMAAKWYAKASSQEHAHAQRALGKLDGNAKLVSMADNDYDRVRIDLTDRDANGKPTQLGDGDSVLRRFKSLWVFEADHWATYDKVGNRFIEVTGDSGGGLRWASGSVLSAKGSFAGVRATSVAEFNSGAGKFGIEKVVWKSEGMAARRHQAASAAIAKIGADVTYNIAACGKDGKNCETFVRECHDGIPVSTQANKALREEPRKTKVVVLMQEFSKTWNEVKGKLLGT